MEMEVFTRKYIYKWVKFQLAMLVETKGKQSSASFNRSLKKKINPLKNHPKMRYCFLKELIRKKVNANEWSVEEVQRFGGFVSKKYPKNLGK